MDRESWALELQRERHENDDDEDLLADEQERAEEYARDERAERALEERHDAEHEASRE